MLIINPTSPYNSTGNGKLEWAVWSVKTAIHIATDAATYVAAVEPRDKRTERMQSSSDHGDLHSGKPSWYEDISIVRSNR